MTETLEPQFIAAIAAGLSAVAALASAFFAYQGPKAAARLAHALESETTKRRETERLKLWIFTSIMQDRRMIHSIECVRALNSIDVIFHDSKEVKDAWSDLLHHLINSNPPDLARRDELLKDMLVKMARDIGISDKLSSNDIHRVYYPDALADQNDVISLGNKLELQRLAGLRRRSADGAGLQQDIIDRWPPPPQQS